MKRLMCAAAVAITALTLPITAADAAKPIRTPACADVVGGAAVASSQLGLPPLLSSSEVVELEQQLAAPACTDVTYSIVVYDGDGGTSGPQTHIGGSNAPASGTGTEADPQRFSIAVDDDDDFVCVAGSTSGTTKKGATVVYDITPEGAPCLLVQINDDDSGGSSGWR